MMTELKKFADRFNKSDDAKPLQQSDIDKLENELRFIMPTDYKTFLLNFGDIWTPDILDIIVDNDLDMNDVQQFWNADRIIYDKQNEWTSQVAADIIPFASDSMGNIFAFLKRDLRSENNTADVYFFDHDFDTIEKISDSFKKWISEFNEI